jgi:hypothetical protein
MQKVSEKIVDGPKFLGGQRERGVPDSLSVRMGFSGLFSEHTRGAAKSQRGRTEGRSGGRAGGRSARDAEGFSLRGAGSRLPRGPGVRGAGGVRAALRGLGAMADCDVAPAPPPSSSLALPPGLAPPPALLSAAGAGASLASAPLGVCLKIVVVATVRLRPGRRGCVEQSERESEREREGARTMCVCV